MNRKWSSALAYVRARFQIYRKLGDFHAEIAKLYAYLDLSEDEERLLLEWIFTDNWEAIRKWRIDHKQRLFNADYAFRRNIVERYRKKHASESERLPDGTD